MIHDIEIQDEPRSFLELELGSEFGRKLVSLIGDSLVTMETRGLDGGIAFDIILSALLYCGIDLCEDAGKEPDFIDAFLASAKE